MLQLGKKLLIQALDNHAGATLLVNARGSRLDIVYANTALELAVGWDGCELSGRPLADLLVDGDLPADEDGLPGRERILVQRWRCRQGQDQMLRFRLDPLYERPGAPAYWLLSESPAASDGRSTARRSLTGAEGRDPATGLPNRRSFEEMLRRDWSLARRQGGRLGMIMFRMDALEAYRELFGRHSTDSCLRKVGHAIAGSLRRGGDAAARFDAGRFAVLIGGASEAQARDFAEQIAARVRILAIHHPRSELDRFVTVSWGVASLQADRSAPSSALVEAAAAALDMQPSAAAASSKAG